MNLMLCRGSPHHHPHPLERFTANGTQGVLPSGTGCANRPTQEGRRRRRRRPTLFLVEVPGPQEEEEVEERLGAVLSALAGAATPAACQAETDAGAYSTRNAFAFFLEGGGGDDNEVGTPPPPAAAATADLVRKVLFSDARVRRHRSVALLTEAGLPRGESGRRRRRRMALLERYDIYAGKVVASCFSTAGPLRPLRDLFAPFPMKVGGEKKLFLINQDFRLTEYLSYQVPD